MGNEKIQLFIGPSDFWIWMWYRRRINDKRNQRRVPKTGYKIVKKRNEKGDGGAQNPIIEQH